MKGKVPCSLSGVKGESGRLLTHDGTEQLAVTPAQQQKLGGRSLSMGLQLAEKQGYCRPAREL